MAEIKKEFKTKLYAVIVFFTVAALLTTITVVTFRSKYNGFNPEKVAVAYVESIVSNGDGYNAYKNSIISKNYKYGDYIREYYMYPIIYSQNNYTPGADTGDLKGYNDESFMSDKTKNDNGELQGKVIDTMYDYYVDLMSHSGGWDNYDLIFTEYFKKLVKVREGIFGDKYMTDEIMFTALEANVSTYGNSLTGTDEVFDENTGLKTSEKTIGLYEKKFGEDYKITLEAKETKKIENLDVFKGAMNTRKLDTYQIASSQINDAVTVNIDVLVNGERIENVQINVVKIGSTWYVDNTSTSTVKLYNIAK